VEATGQPSLHDLVLRGAADIEKVSTEFDAELLLSTLLGSVYGAAAGPDRWRVVQEFMGTFDAYLRNKRSSRARAVRTVLGRLRGGPAAGSLRVTGAYACGDRYGDQTSYVATFAYADAEHGGPEHAMVLLVDHNIGQVKEIMLVAPADVVLAALREQVATDPDALAWFAEVEPSTVGAAAAAYLPLTDVSPEPPDESMRANRVIAQARCALLGVAAVAAVDPLAAVEPPADGADRAALIEEFLDSPEAVMADLASITGAQRESLTYCLGLFVDFATARGDVQRWSPRSVEMFMLDWVHEHAVLDGDDVAMLPAALGPWVFWAGRRTDLPSAPLQRTFAQVGLLRPEFERLCASGERQSPAARAMARLMADGIDITDAAAVDAWLATYNAAEG
jgi:hypothetical protein